MLPCIGHTGICDSKGFVHDFAGPYTITIDNFSFGETHKYVTLNLDGITPEQFNEAVKKADAVYGRRMHNICCDNCHSHVAMVLNNLNYKGKQNYTMIDIWLMCSIKSEYVTYYHTLMTYWLWAIVALICGWMKFFGSH